MHLKKILKQIRDKTIEADIRHATVRENRPVKAIIDQRSIGTLDELMGMSVACFQYQYKHAVLQDPDAPDLPEDIVWEDVREILERKYVDLKGALRAVRLGVDGGIRGVIEGITDSIRQAHVKALHKHIIETHLPSVDRDAKVALAREFLRSVSAVVREEDQVSPGELANRIYKAVEGLIKRTSVSLKGASPSR